MPAVPIYVWNGTAWQETGPTIPASPIKYQASAPSSPSTGDIWVNSAVDVTTGSQQFQRFRFVASGGETSLSGADANSAVLAYTAGTEIVVLNGSTLVRGSDYTATNGTSITGLSPALVAGDVVEVFSFMAFNVANTYTQSQVDGLLNDYMGMRLIVPTSATNGTVSSTGAVSFTTASSVSLNGVFSSTYENYKIIINITGVSTQMDILMRLSNNGTDNSSAVYSRGGVYNYINSTPTALAGVGATSWPLGYVNSGTGSKNAFSIDMYRPNIAAETTALNMGVWNNNVTFAGFFVGYLHDSATSFNGFTIYPNTGTMSGTIRVYGYKS